MREVRKVAWIIVIALVMAALALLVACWTAPFRAPGRKLAQKIIELSDRGTRPVSLSSFGEKVCLVPEGGYARMYAEGLFGHYKLSYVESNESSGIWFFISSNAEKKEVHINAIPQPVLRWTIPGTSTLRVICPQEINVVIKSAGVPEIAISSPKGR